MALRDETKETTNKKHVEETPEEQSGNLKGTFFFVMSLGVFLIVSWAAVYGIFITR